MAPDHTAAVSGPGISRVGQIAVPVRDLDRAVAFYRDVLGLRFLFQAPPGLAFFDCGGVRLMLTLPEGPENARHSSVLYYLVDDIQAAWAAVTARGREAGHGRRARAAPDREAPGPRPLDGVRGGQRGEPAGPDERGPAADGE